MGIAEENNSESYSVHFSHNAFNLCSEQTKVTLDLFACRVKTVKYCLKASLSPTLASPDFFHDNGKNQTYSCPSWNLQYIFPVGTVLNGSYVLLKKYIDKLMVYDDIKTDLLEMA